MTPNEKLAWWRAKADEIRAKSIPPAEPNSARRFLWSMAGVIGVGLVMALLLVWAFGCHAIAYSQVEGSCEVKPLRTTERFVFASDNHGDLADTKACRFVLDWCKHFKPTHRIHGGDAVDLVALRGRATDDDRLRGFNDDMQDGCELLKAYAPTHYLLGNHEFRLQKDIDSPNHTKAQFASLLYDSLLQAAGNARVYPYCKRKGILTIHKLSFLHGYTTGIYAVRKAALSFGDCVMGHIHRIDQAAVERHVKVTGYSSGCLCRTDLGYNVGQVGTLAQEPGFVYGWFVRGKAVVIQARKVGNQWVLPSEVMSNAA